MTSKKNSVAEDEFNDLEIVSPKMLKDLPKETEEEKADKEKLKQEQLCKHLKKIIRVWMQKGVKIPLKLNVGGLHQDKVDRLKSKFEKAGYDVQEVNTRLIITPL